MFDERCIVLQSPQWEVGRHLFASPSPVLARNPWEVCGVYNPTSRKQQLLLREYLGTFREQEYQQVTGRLAAMLYGATFMVRAPAKLFKEVSEIVLSASLVVYGVGRGQMESRRFPQGCLKTSCCCQRS